MNTALAYPEPYRMPAGLLALAVHIAFFALLYFGVHWQSQPPEAFTVEMWDNLPNAEPTPEQAPPPPPPPAKMEPKAPAKVVAPVLPSAKADIEIRDKKNKKAEKQAKDTKKEKAAAKARQEAERRELEAYSERISSEQERIKAEQARVRAEVNAATQTQVDRYQDMIRNKIRRKMKMVADVPGSAEAIYKVTLLPDGTLMDDPVLVKSSGFAAYDDAAARAIIAASPLPVPTDATLQKMFRELKLSIKP
jgi:colicin import membrane protein